MSGPDVLDTPAAGPAAIRGTAIRMAAYVLSIVLALASAPLLIRHLGIEEFGRYALVGSLLGILGGVFDAGLVSVAQREYVALEGAARRKALRDLLGLRIVLSVIAVALAIGFAAIAGYGSTLVLGTAIAGAGAILLGVQTILAVPLLARLQLGRITAVDLLRSVLTVVLIVVLVVLDGSLLAFLAVSLPVGAAAMLATMAMTRGLAPFKPSADTAAWSELLRAVVPFSAAQAITAVYFRITLVLLDLVQSDLETGLYATSYRIIEVVIAIPALLVSAVFPVMAKAAIGDDVRLKYVVGRVTEVGLILGPWMALSLILGADTIVQILAGDEGAPAADVLRIQALAVIATFVAVSCAFPLLSLHRHREVLVANLWALAGSVVLTLALAPSFGAEGAAVATVVAELLLAGAMAVMLRRAQPGLQLPLHALPPIILATAVAAATVFLPIHEFARVALATVLYFGVLAILGRIPEELRDALTRGATKRGMQ